LLILPTQKQGTRCLLLVISFFQINIVLNNKILGLIPAAGNR